MYNTIKKKKDSNDLWEKFMKYVRDENILVIVANHGKNYMKIIYNPDAPDQIKEIYL